MRASFSLLVLSYSGCSAAAFSLRSRQLLGVALTPPPFNSKHWVVTPNNLGSFSCRDSTAEQFADLSPTSQSLEICLLDIGRTLHTDLVLSECIVVATLLLRNL